MVLPDDAAVLMIRLSAMGDVLFALETLSSLKSERPDVHVDFLVEDRFAALLEGHPLIDNVLVYPRRRKLAFPGWVKRLRARRYDAVLDLHGNLKSAVHARLARSRERIGYAPPIAREGCHHLYTRAVELPEPRPHRADQGYELLRAMGLRGDRARAVLPELEAPADAPVADVVLHPGTSAFAQFKRWPLASFAELAERLTGRGIAVAINVGPGERDLAQSLCDRVPELAVIDGAAIGLARLGAVFARAQVVVAADTGPLHLAAAAGARVVALFGPKDPDIYGPRGDGHHVLYRDVPCRPCRRRTCPSPLCILGVAIDDVEAAVTELLEAAPTP